MNRRKDYSVKWNVINSCIAGALVFLGSIADGEVTYKGILIAIVAAAAIALTKFRDFWAKRGDQMFNFI